MWFYFWLLKLLKEWLQRGCQSFAKNTILLQGQEIILKMGKSNWSWQKMILRQLKFVLHLRFAASTTMGKLLEIYWGEVMGRSMTLLLLLSIRALTFGFVPSLLSQHFPPQFSWHSPPPLSIIIMLAKIIYVYEHASWISHEYSAFSTIFYQIWKQFRHYYERHHFSPTSSCPGLGFPRRGHFSVVGVVSDTEYPHIITPEPTPEKSGKKAEQSLITPPGKVSSLKYIYYSNCHVEWKSKKEKEK